MHSLIPNSGSAAEFGEAQGKKKGKGPEIHSAKAHRCVDKVMAKGHPESNAWAICTASIGAEGVYARGHGGSASPKRRKARESELDAERDAIINEANDCHSPAGSPQGGQFCGKGKGDSFLSRALKIAKRAFGAPAVTGGAGFNMPTPLPAGDIRVGRSHDADKVRHRQALQGGRGDTDYVAPVHKAAPAGKPLSMDFERAGHGFYQLRKRK